MMDTISYLKKLQETCDLYYTSLMKWYEQEQDIAVLPDPVIESFLGLVGGLYLTFSYEMEGLEKWYAKEFDRIKFLEAKPLSDKAADQKIKILPEGQRIITLERRLKALKFAKEAISRSVQSRIEQRKQANLIMRT